MHKRLPDHKKFPLCFLASKSLGWKSLPMGVMARWLAIDNARLRGWAGLVALPGGFGAGGIYSSVTLLPVRLFNLWALGRWRCSLLARRCMFAPRGGPILIPRC